jgi:hypothetical protein
MGHLILFGDSVLDDYVFKNGACTETGEPDVARQLSSRPPLGDEVTLPAADD